MYGNTTDVEQLLHKTMLKMTQKAVSFDKPGSIKISSFFEDTPYTVNHKLPAVSKLEKRDMFETAEL